MPTKSQTIDQVKDLQEMRLPSGWKMIKAEVEFEHPGLIDEHIKVVWDSHNNVFYVHGHNIIVYPERTVIIQEAFDIMQRANKVMGSTRPKGENE